MGLAARTTAVATGLIASLGYGGLAVGLVVDSAGVPIPSEVLLPLSGALVRQGRFSLAAVIAVATIAQTAGAGLAYWIGAKGGVPLVQRYGRYVLFSERELAHTQKWFASHGTQAAFWGRCLPGIRTYIGYPAGIARMNFGRFIAASIAGSLGWSTILTLAGYYLSNQIDTISRLLGQAGYAILALLILAGIWYVWRHHKASA